MSDRTPADVARLFHETYERLAPEFGYRTSEASAVPWDEVPEANRALMIATVTEVLAGFRVVPIPDDNTRALATRLRNAATVACEAWGESADADVPVVEVGGYPATHTLGTADLLAAAALLDGQPEHVGGSGDTR